MEYVQRGSMLNYLRKCRPSSRVSSDSGISIIQTNSSFMEPRAKDLSIFALQIARGMTHIGSIGVRSFDGAFDTYKYSFTPHTHEK